MLGRSAKKETQDSSEQKDERNDVPKAMRAGAPEHTRRVYEVTEYDGLGASTRIEPRRL